VAVFLLAIHLSGCEPPLAVQDSYFARDWDRGQAPAVAAETLRTARHLQAVQEVLRRCRVPADTAGELSGADLGTAAARAALVELCAASADRTTAAVGGTANAYRRWLEDRVRELPGPSAARAGSD
jgi:hypothetical protein